MSTTARAKRVAPRSGGPLRNCRSVQVWWLALTHISPAGRESHDGRPGGGVGRDVSARPCHSGARHHRWLALLAAGLSFISIGALRGIVCRALVAGLMLSA